MSAKPLLDYYRILNVSVDAQPEEISGSFRYLVKKFHPDMSGRSDYKQVLHIIEAYKILMDPVQKAEYDAAYVIYFGSINSNTETDKNFSTQSADKNREKKEFVVIPKNRIQYAFSMQELLKEGLLRKRHKKNEIYRRMQKRFDVSVSLLPQERNKNIYLLMDLPVKSRCPHCNGHPTWASVCPLCEGYGQITEMRESKILIPGDLPSGSIVEVNLRSINPGNLSYFRLKTLKVRILS